MKPRSRFLVPLVLLALVLLIPAGAEQGGAPRVRAEEASALKEAQQKLSDSAEQQPDNSKVTQQTVSKEVEALRAKLQERRKVHELPEGVEAARNEVVRCLRENDRRPLDCWKEVEAFKEEVRRLEKGWVDKVVS